MPTSRQEALLPIGLANRISGLYASCVRRLTRTPSSVADEPESHPKNEKYVLAALPQTHCQNDHCVALIFVMVAFTKTKQINIDMSVTGVSWVRHHPLELVLR